MMKMMGISDEAANTIDRQIAATRALGWKHIEMRGVEVPGFAKGNLHEIPEAAFEIAAGKLKEAGLEVYCFGSTIMNWSKKWTDPFEVTVGEVRRAIARMQQLGTKFVRIMSFKPEEEEEGIPAEVIRRVNEVVGMFGDAGIQVLHENCMNHGGMSWRHAVELLEKCPGLQWLFDPANPVFNADRSKAKPWPRQDPLEFWRHVRERVAHIHIKDAVWNPAKKDAEYRWPGEGDGRIVEILTDAFGRGYDGGISIEPHMVVVFHDAGSAADDGAIEANFVEYGRRTEGLIARVKSQMGEKRLAAGLSLS